MTGTKRRGRVVYIMDRLTVQQGRAPDKLCLGIDHSAIVVNDTEAGRALYHDVPGADI